MKVQRFDDPSTLAQSASLYIFKKIEEKILHGDRFVLGLATGATPKLTYEYLLTYLCVSTLNLENLFTFNLDEYIGLTADDSHSFYFEIQKYFCQPLMLCHPEFDVKTHAFIPNSNAQNIELECDDYEKKIRSIGGIDLQILGIGANGHIGFNEPGSDFTSRTRKVKLTEESRQSNAKYFGGDTSKVPTEAITVGIGTIMEAKEILLLATDSSKAAAIEELINESKPENEQSPATALKNRGNVQVLYSFPV